tara:strand:- start:174 stop:437 length:264 start_codon:yes stop_codon:yes gene_type:complete
MIVTYDKVQFDAAVNHVLTHNHLLGVTTRAEGEAFLTRLIKSGAKSTSSYISSGGYTIIFGCEDAMTCAEITVDATFKDCAYIQIEA